MVSKWAFEGLAVNQFKNNKFNKQFYYVDKDLKQASFRKNFWLTSLKDKVNYLKRHKDNKDHLEEIENGLKLLSNEIRKENQLNSEIQYDKTENITIENLNQDLINSLSAYISDLNSYYIEEYNYYSNKKDKLLKLVQLTDEKKEAYIEMKNDYTNESLEDLVTNKNDFDKIIEWKNELIQRADPIYKDPNGFRSHFLAPSKKLFGVNLTTFSANMMVIWLISIGLAISLYYDALRKGLEVLGRIFKKKKY